MKRILQIQGFVASRFNLQTFLRVTNRVTQRLAGGWYCEDIFFRHRIFAKSPLRAGLWGLALLPLALMRRGLTAMSRRLEFTRVELAITTRCSLRCRDCANLIPFYASPSDVELATLIREVDDFLGLVDRVHSFSIMGGEACLHPGLAKVIAHLVQQDKIGTVQLATNGTIVPHEDVLAVLTHPKVVVSVSDYPAELVRNKFALLAKLKERGVNFVFRAGMGWKDFGGFAPQLDAGEAALVNRFRHCWGRQFHNLIDGKFHLCPRSAHGSRLGQFPVDPQDSVQCIGRQDRRQARAEFRRLCARKYLAACTKCLGGVAAIPPAIQMVHGSRA